MAQQTRMTDSTKVAHTVEGLRPILGTWLFDDLLARSKELAAATVLARPDDYDLSPEEMAGIREHGLLGSSLPPGAFWTVSHDGDWITVTQYENSGNGGYVDSWTWDGTSWDSTENA